MYCYISIFIYRYILAVAFRVSFFYSIERTQNDFTVVFLPPLCGPAAVRQFGQPSESHVTNISKYSYSQGNSQSSSVRAMFCLAKIKMCTASQQQQKKKIERKTPLAAAQ